MNDGHPFSIRASASTSSAKIATVRDADIRVPCTTTPCTGKDGGSYTCWSGGPRDNVWLKVKLGSRLGWVAGRCVEGGRL
ncbi:hypothetical protein GCM10010307_48580 [Streptomyces vastus]|uniref:SH3 domain-containing protein n=1 Tax=Streptomyces vastus TaxID=285451 RepID=A0ABP6DG42_9ACTN